MLLADYESYIRTQEKVDKLFQVSYSKHYLNIKKIKNKNFILC
jgi:hypothetical protein